MSDDVDIRAGSGRRADLDWEVVDRAPRLRVGRAFRSERLSPWRLPSVSSHGSCSATMTAPRTRELRAPRPR
jgi:hypothetical protein